MVIKKQTKIEKHLGLAIIIMALSSFGAIDSVFWKSDKDFSLTIDEKKVVLELASSLGLNHIYQVESGNLSHIGYYSLVVKSIVSESDSLRNEKWLNLWNNRWTNNKKNINRTFDDVSIVKGTIITGRKNIKEIKQYIYTKNGFRKYFQLPSNCTYKEVKEIMDGATDGKAFIDTSMVFASTIHCFKKTSFLDFGKIWKAVGRFTTIYCFQYFKSDDCRGFALEVSLDRCGYLIKVFQISD